MSQEQTDDTKKEKVINQVIDILTRKNTSVTTQYAGKLIKIHTLESNERIKAALERSNLPIPSKDTLPEARLVQEYTTLTSSSAGTADNTNVPDHVHTVQETEPTPPQLDQIPASDAAYDATIIEVEHPGVKLDQTTSHKMEGGTPPTEIASTSQTNNTNLPLPDHVINQINKQLSNHIPEDTLKEVINALKSNNANLVTQSNLKSLTDQKVVEALRDCAEGQKIEVAGELSNKIMKYIGSPERLIQCILNGQHQEALKLLEDNPVLYDETFDIRDSTSAKTKGSNNGKGFCCFGEKGNLAVWKDHSPENQLSTLLHVVCALGGSIDIIQKLLTSKIDINAQDRRKYDAMDYAIESGHADFVDALLDKNAHITKKHLERAITEGKYPVVHKILEKYPKFLEGKDTNKFLNLAINSGNNNIFHEVCEKTPKEAIKNYTFENNGNILHQIAKNGNATMLITVMLKTPEFALLLKSKDTLGNLPLHIAAYREKDVYELFKTPLSQYTENKVSKGKNILTHISLKNEKNFYGHTADDIQNNLLHQSTEATTADNTVDIEDQESSPLLGNGQQHDDD